MEKISEREFHYIKRLSENYVGLTAEKTIKVVSCDTGEEVFVSDKLSNMYGATYNEKTKKLLLITHQDMHIYISYLMENAFYLKYI